MNTKKPVILCVDDEPCNLALLEALLVPRGYEVLKSENGREALARISEQKIDLVLLDVMMPELDGFEVCRKIKDNDRYRSIPVVMITAMTAKEDRVRAIEAGAEDFISKPIDSSEVLARIRMLLKIKELNDRLSSAYGTITSMVRFGETMAMSFDPLLFDFLPKLDDIIRYILRGRLEQTDKPEIVIVGFVDENAAWQWYQFDSVLRELHRTWLRSEPMKYLNIPLSDNTRIFYSNEEDLERSGYGAFIKFLKSRSIKVTSLVCFMSSRFSIFGLNYGKIVSGFDAEVINSIVMQSLFMKSLAGQVRETEHAFDYLVYSLARAAEANDEDTGNHILRVGEYCALIAGELALPDKFTAILRIQATLHDVGKIHVDPRILKKPEKLDPSEYDEIKKHTLYGAKILGDHVRLTLAKKAALSHHERWDGSGYPYGLKGDQIPLEGRILNIADQYDALRNMRVYKPGFDHHTTCRILTEGDGRTMPNHFDPQVLDAFRNTKGKFEEIYKRING